MIRRNNKSIYIDAMSFAQERKSGIGHIAEQIAVNLAQSLDKNGIVVYLVVNLGKAKFIKKYSNKNIRIRTIPLPARVFNLLSNYNLLPPMDLLLGRGIYIFPNYRNWRLSHSRSLTYIHDLVYLNFEHFVEPKNLKYLKRNVPVWVERADVIITASEYTKKEISQRLGVEFDKIAVVQHGVDTKMFTKLKIRDYCKTLKKYGVTETSYILHLGNIEPRKNIVGLISAYGKLDLRVRCKHPLLLVGGGGWLNENEMSSIENGIKSGLNIVRPNRYVEDSDLPAFYSAASVVVTPSFYEGFGMSPLQAMSCGVPTVVSDNSSLHELFGGVSVLVDPNDSDNIRDGINQALGMTVSEERSYRSQALRLASKFSWGATALKLKNLIYEKGL